MSELSRALNIAIQSACETLLWSEIDHDGIPLDAKYDSLAKADFQAYCQVVSGVTKALSKYKDMALCDPMLFGHDYILTRNGHGSGFWDGDWDSYPQSTIDAICAYCEKLGLIEVVES